MVSAERQRELRRAKKPPCPRPRGRGPPGCTWNSQTGGWFKDDGSRKTVVRNEKRKLAAASEKENREKQLADAEELDRSFAESVRFDGESVYCQHLRPLNGKCVIKDRALWENPTSGGQPQQHRACEIVHAEARRWSIRRR